MTDQETGVPHNPDIGMPNMDGYELATRLRAMDSGANVPLVAMTGFTRSNDVQRALRSGFNAHIGKPLSIAKLTETLQRLLPGSKSYPDARPLAHRARCVSGE